MHQPRLVYVVTHPVTADVLLRGQLAFMREQGFDVTVIASPGKELERVAEREAVRTIGIPLVRAPHPTDPKALGSVVAALRKLRPHIVNASTPKAGLLGMLAARALGTPVRIYLNRGLRLETARGALRRVLGVTERIAATCANDVICVSESLRRAVVDGGYAPAAKTRVLGGGSSNGVDVTRFRRDASLREIGRARLAAHGVQADESVILFVGRFAIDKGILDAVRSFAARGHRRAKLVVVGGDFGDEGLDPASAQYVKSVAGVVPVGRSDDLPSFYAAADVVLFPSFREGFPNVPLEAAAAEIPVVAYRATGTSDAVVDGATGRLVDIGDIAGATAAIDAYLDDAALVRRHGRAARERVVAEYSNDRVWQRWLTTYRRSLERQGLPLPSRGR